MANLVRRHLESMTEEIEEMKRLLFKEHEIKAIIRKRDQFEHKINGISKKLQDFMNYIKFEKTLIKEIKTRRKKEKISERKGSLDYKIIRRVRSLYEIAIQRFAYSFPLHLSFFMFAKQFHFNGAASMAIQDMIKKFSHEPEVWQVAGAYYAYEKKNIDEALKVIYEGLTIHKNSKVLFGEVIKLEIHRMNESKAMEPNQLIKKSLKSIEVYVQLIFKYVDDFNFYILILELLKDQKFTVDVQNEIIKTLLQNHKNEEKVWDALAKRELDGLHCDLLEIDLKSPLELCIQTYEKGLQEVPEEKKPNLWTLYLNCLANLRNEEAFKDTKDFINNLLRTVLSRASDEITLTENYFKLWITLTDSEESVELILAKATRSLSNSTEMWQLCLKYYIMKQNMDKIRKVFEDGKECLRGEAIELWHLYINYHSSVSSFEDIKSIYESAIAETDTISNVFKPLYLEWIVNIRNLNEGRLIYKKLSTEKPFCKQLHTTMLKLETTQQNIDYSFCEQVFELACKQFGQTDTDIWIEYIKFYSTSIKKLQVPDIIKRAEMYLSPHLKFKFQNELNNL